MHNPHPLLRFLVPPLFALIALSVSAERPAPGAAHAADSPDATATRSELVLKSPSERGQKIRSTYSKFEFRIPMRDGKRLFTSVYVPNDAGADKRYPILLTRTPYSAAPYGVDRYREALGPTEDYEKEGFIFVIQDVRGRYMSEGEFVNMRPQIENKSRGDIDESTDTYDSIDWLVKKLPHNNGKVGMWGISYPGFYTSAGAIDSHPALKAVSPQAPIADWFRGDDMHRNGAFNLQLSFAFFSGFGKPRPEPTDNEDWDRFKFGTPDAYQFFLDAGALSNLDTQHFKGEIPFWKEIAAHPDYDSFWQQRNLLPHLKNIKAAVLTVGGWYDTEDLYGPLHTYAAIEKQNPGIHNSLVIGPWIHGGWLRGDGATLGDTDFGFKTSLSYRPLELAFFNQHLREGKAAALPEAMVFETGANRWRQFDAWPPKGLRAQTLYFADAGALSETAPVATAGFDEYPSDPAKPVPYTLEIAQRWGRHYLAEDQRFAARRPDVLVYQSEPLQQDLTIAGPLEASLFFSTDQSDADVVVKLIDVNPGRQRGWTDNDADAGKRDYGGQQTLVRGEPFRARFRDGFDTPRALTPNEVTPVKFALNDVLHTFKRGHRIMVQVQSTWFPFIDRNPQRYVPNIFEATDADFVKANHRVYRTADHPSAIRVQVLPALDAM
jgi:putative CocE/NonD family hydrolase